MMKLRRKNYFNTQGSLDKYKYIYIAMLLICYRYFIFNLGEAIFNEFGVAIFHSFPFFIEFIIRLRINFKTAENIS